MIEEAGEKGGREIGAGWGGEERTGWGGQNEDEDRRERQRPRLPTAET